MISPLPRNLYELQWMFIGCLLPAKGRSKPFTWIPSLNPCNRPLRLGTLTIKVTNGETEVQTWAETCPRSGSHQEAEGVSQDLLGQQRGAGKRKACSHRPIRAGLNSLPGQVRELRKKIINKGKEEADGVGDRTRPI